MAQDDSSSRTATCALCGRHIVVKPKSHLKLAGGQRAHFDCLLMAYRRGYIRPGIHLVRVCSELGCDEPGCHRWTHRKAILVPPKPDEFEMIPPFAQAVTEPRHCEDCGTPLTPHDGVYLPTWDGTFIHLECSIDRLAGGIASFPITR